MIYSLWSIVYGLRLWCLRPFMKPMEAWMPGAARQELPEPVASPGGCPLPDQSPWSPGACQHAVPALEPWPRPQMPKKNQKSIGKTKKPKKPKFGNLWGPGPWAWPGLSSVSNFGFFVFFDFSNAFLVLFGCSSLYLGIQAKAETSHPDRLQGFRIDFPGPRRHRQLWFCRSKRGLLAYIYYICIYIY